MMTNTRDRHHFLFTCFTLGAFSELYIRFCVSVYLFSPIKVLFSHLILSSLSHRTPYRSSLNPPLSITAKVSYVHVFDLITPMALTGNSDIVI